MPIRKGDKAAPFTLPARPGELVDVGAHIGTKRVVLLFFPFAFSPVCTEEMCEMRDGWDDWDGLDAKVFGVTADSPFVTDRFRTDLSIPFPILSDFNKDVITTYGVAHDELAGMKVVPKRAAFVIDSDGTVIYDWITENPKERPNLDEVRSALGESVNA